MNPFDLDFRVHQLGPKRGAGIKPLGDPSETCWFVPATDTCGQPMYTWATCNSIACQTNTCFGGHTYITCGETCFTGPQ